jgi:hypothetical protein
VGRVCQRSSGKGEISQLGKVMGQLHSEELRVGSSHASQPKVEE